MKKLISSADLIEALNNKDININENPSDIIDINIFSRPKVPNTLTETESYVCFSVNCRGANSRNVYFKDIEIVFMCISHENEARTQWNANRHDIIGGIIIELFNWSNDLGFELELLFDTESVIQNQYNTRSIGFKCNHLNSVSNGVKSNGKR
jgi:hypothetical protein